LWILICVLCKLVLISAENKAKIGMFLVCINKELAVTEDNAVGEFTKAHPHVYQERKKLLLLERG
jgi:hypothetical protein